ncbi:MAG: TIGR03862 family flavoprotein [Chthoniobacteraceae bacterium]
MHIAIIGGGPAGLRAAEVAAGAGAHVTVFDAKASVGRKFLVAGRGGLNITKAEPRELFASRYLDGENSVGRWAKLIADFDPAALREWAAGLGIETFVASTGRVYPREMKAAPLLRRWVERLRGLGAKFVLHHRWVGLAPGHPLRLDFRVGEDHVSVEADAAVFALGGGSWPETGSDGAWTTSLAKLGVAVSPLVPANCGWELPWPPAVLAVAEGQPLKSIAVRAGGQEVRGELLVTRYGLEGGAIYQLGSVLRAMPEPTITIDFKPTFTAAQLLAKMGPITRNFAAEGRERLRLSEAAIAILANVSREWKTAAEFVADVKACPLRFTAPRPIAEAISSAGGVRWSELDENLMLRRVPGVFVAGEMIDWEAPTGGYLMQGCFATGTRAGAAAVRFSGGPPSKTLPSVPDLP